MQLDEKLVIGGNFGAVNGVARNCIARLNADGTPDSAFNPNVDRDVRSTAIQTDGNIIIGGEFTSVGGVVRNHVARINADGTLDTGFNPNVGGSIPFVESIAVQVDGKIVIGGYFTTVGGVARRGVARVNANGTLDTSFNPNPNSASLAVISIALQVDGKIVIGGFFTSVGGVARNCIARLNIDGTLDTGFNPDANDYVTSMAVQADGKIVIVGFFTSVGGVARNRIARLNADGTLDTGFNPNANANVGSAALQADGKIILGGAAFTTVGGVARNYIARLENDSATGSLTVPSPSRVQWLRGGTSPETLQATFELSTNSGSIWTPLGAGTRIAGGWELTGLSLPASGQVRARARTIGGQFNGSSRLMEMVTAPFTFGTPFTDWKLAQLADAAAPDLGDIDSDGLVHLAEYGLVLSPTMPSLPPPTERFAYPEGERLRMCFTRDPARNDITIEVQAAADLAGPWTTVATSALGDVTTGPGYVGGDGATPGLKIVEVRDVVNLPDAPTRFLRLKITH